MAYTLTVHHGKEKHKLELAAGSSVGDAKVALFAVAGVAAADQRLLHKGKECGGDEARLLADLKVKPKDKMLLLLSQAAGERAASTAAAAKLTASRAAAKDALAAVTFGSSAGGSAAGLAAAAPPLPPASPSSFSEAAVGGGGAVAVDAAGGSAGAGDAFWVEVVQGKTKIRCELGAGMGPDEATVAEVKGIAARALGVPVSGLKLLGKGGKSPADGATLAEAKLGKCGSRLLAMLTRSGHAEKEAAAATVTLAEELEAVEGAVRSVLSKVRHRFITHTELTFKVTELDDAVSRAADRVEHTKAQSQAQLRQELGARVQKLQKDMREIRRFHMDGVHSASSS